MGLDVSQLPAWSGAWAGQRLDQHTRTGHEVTREQWTGLRDWLVSLPTHRPRMVDKLHKLTMEQALLASTRWHTAMAVRSQRIAREQAAFGGDPNAVEPIAPLAGVDDFLQPGWRWVHVCTPQGLDYEGAAMGHCVGGGAYDEGASILSLRDPDNMPHCTIEWDPEARTVEQVQGRGNSTIVERYHGAVAAFINTLQPLAVEGSSKFGHILANDRLVHWSQLRAGARIQGNMELIGCIGLLELPDNLYVTGSLVIRDCPDLACLPRGLNITGSLHMSRCHDLVDLPGDLRVGDNMFLSQCPNLETIPHGVLGTHTTYVTIEHCPGLAALPRGLLQLSSLRLIDCPGINRLPDDIGVGDLSIMGKSGIHELPAGLTALRTLDLVGCTSMQTLPQGLKVAEWMDLERCTGIRNLPDNLGVGDWLRLSGCTSLQCLPDGLKVGRWLRLDGCTSLGPLPEHLDVRGEIIPPEHYGATRDPGLDHGRRP